jgi:uncharacterized protein involved in exopolysaccharide biosynthesis
MENLYQNNTTFRDFIHTIFKRKTQIILFFIIVFGGVATATLLSKPIYESTANILVKLGRENLYLPTGGQLNPLISIDLIQQVNSEIEILKSRSLADTVIGSIGSSQLYGSIYTKKKIFDIIRLPVQKPTQEMAVIKFKKGLGVEWVKQSSIIRVSFRHYDPQMAALVLNTLTDAYLNLHLKVHETQRSYTFFEDQLYQFKTKLKQSEETLKQFRQKNSITSLSEEKKLLLHQGNGIRSAIDATENQLAETENRIAQLKIQISETPQIVPQTEEINNNPYLISTLESKLLELELEEKELLGKYTERSRAVQNIRGELKVLREKLAKQEDKRYEKSSFGASKTYQLLWEKILQNEADQKALVGKLLLQKNQLSTYQRKLDTLNGLDFKLMQLNREVESDRQNYQLYLTRFEESRISKAMDTEKITNVNIIEPATPPFKPVSPKVMLNLLLGLCLGAFGGFGLAFFREYFDDSLENIDDVERHLKLPVLVSIPDFKK